MASIFVCCRVHGLFQNIQHGRCFLFWQLYLWFISVQRSKLKMQDAGYRMQDNHASWRRGFVVVLISGILIGVVFWYKSDVFLNQIKLLLNYQQPGLKRWGESFISTFFFQIHPFITAAAIYSAYAAFKKKDLKYLIIIWLIFLMAVLQIKRIRYIIMIFPLLTLMASYGLQEIKDKRIVRFIVSCTVVFSLLIAVLAYFPFLRKTSAANIKKTQAVFECA